MMRIKKIQVLNADGGWRPWTFIKITTSEDLIGWSECTDSHGSPMGLSATIKELSDLLIDKNPLEINKILALLYSRTRQSPGSIIHKAIAGIENALWDIFAKSLNCPVNYLFGGSVRDQINLYWSHCGTSRVRASDLICKQKISSIEDLEIFSHEIKKSGFKSIKTNIARLSEKPYVYMPGFGKTDGYPELNLNYSLENDIVSWISNFRKFLGNEYEIALDLNFNFKTDGYIKVCKLLEEFNLSWIEIDCYNPLSLSNIRDKVNIPITSCENLYGLNQFKPFFDKPCIDYCSIDVIWNGFTESLKIAELANLNDINISCHNFNGHLSTFISMHFCSLVNNFKIGEIDVDDVPWRDEIFSDIPTIKDGNFQFNHKPGWGCNINEKGLKKYSWS